MFIIKPHLAGLGLCVSFIHNSDVSTYIQTHGDLYLKLYFFFAKFQFH